MDTVFLKGVVVEAVIGVHAWERVLSRRLLLDLEMGVDVRRTAGSDRIEDTVDYSRAAQLLRERAAATRYALIETLAEDLARLLVTDLSLPWLRLTVHKPGAVPGVADLGVTVERRRADYP